MALKYVAAHASGSYYRCGAVANILYRMAAGALVIFRGALARPPNAKRRYIYKLHQRFKFSSFYAYINTSPPRLHLVSFKNPLVCCRSVDLLTYIPIASAPYPASIRDAVISTTKGGPGCWASSIRRRPLIIQNPGCARMWPVASTFWITRHFDSLYLQPPQLYSNSANALSFTA